MTPYFKNLGAILLFAWIFFTSTIEAQKSANTILSSVYKQMQKTKAYNADVLIVANLPLVKIEPVLAVLSFNQQEKFKLVSKGIAILPKQGLNNLTAIIKDTNSFTAIATAKEILQSVSTMIINVIPNSDTGDVILAKLWIDPIRSLVYKSQITTRENGTLLLEYYYKTQLDKGLPDSLVFTVDIKKFKLPKGVVTDINRTTEPGDKKQAPTNGKIVMTINNYRFL